tara:strand:+ start:195 stop:473 length:279 start_codon:yes stop_codon:yes gene_type:complete
MEFENNEWGWFVREDAPHLPFDINNKLRSKNKKFKIQRLETVEEEHTNSKSSMIAKLDNKYDFGNIFATCFTYLGFIISINISFNIMKPFRN